MHAGAVTARICSVFRHSSSAWPIFVLTGFKMLKMCCTSASIHVSIHVYRDLGRGLPLTLPDIRQSVDATNASCPDLDHGVLPGQQAVVRCRNSVKVEDFLNSFFIHSIFVQTLSDMCVLLSPVRQGVAIQPRGWMCMTRLHVWLPRKPVIEWASVAGPHMAWAGRKCCPVDQRFRPARARRDDLLVGSPQIYAFTKTNLHVHVGPTSSCQARLGLRAAD